MCLCVCLCSLNKCFELIPILIELCQQSFFKSECLCVCLMCLLKPIHSGYGSKFLYAIFICYLHFILWDVISSTFSLILQNPLLNGTFLCFLVHVLSQLFSLFFLIYYYYSFYKIISRFYFSYKLKFYLNIIIIFHYFHLSSFKRKLKE